MLYCPGTDEVVKAYNRLKQFYYADKADGTDESTKEFLGVIARLVLAIRKSVGNSKTRISEADAMWWFIKDVDKVFQ